MKSRSSILLKFMLKPVIKTKFEKDKERAERIIHKAENLCLISNSVKTKILLSPQIVS